MTPQALAVRMSQLREWQATRAVSFRVARCPVCREPVMACTMPAGKCTGLGYVHTRTRMHACAGGATWRQSKKNLWLARLS